MAALQAAVLAPRRVAGVQLIDCALRRLHVRRQAPLQRPLVGALQAVLRDTWLGRAFYANVAKEEVGRRAPSGGCTASWWMSQARSMTFSVWGQKESSC